MERTYKTNSPIINYLKQKRAIVFLSILAILLLGLFGYLVLSQKPGSVDTFQVKEPDAPLSQEVNSSVLGAKDSTTPTPTVSQDSNASSDAGSNQGSSSGSTGRTPTQAPAQPQTKIADLGVVLNAKRSENNEYVAVLTSKNQPVAENNSLQAIFPGVYAADTNEAFTLSLANKDGVVLDTIEQNKVTDMDFSGNDYVYYQAIGSGAGIYQYDIKKKTKHILVYTYDTQSFNNVVSIDQDKFFFIQPTTGKIGFGKLSSKDVTILDEKVLNTKSTYVKASAYAFASLSPNKKYVALYDLDADKDLKSTIKIYPVTATSKNDLYFEAKVSYHSGAFRDIVNAFSWSSNSKYLAAGSNGIIIDIEKKEIVFNGEEDSVTKISPDNKHFVSYNPATGDATLKELGGNASTVIGTGISDLEWFNNDYLLFVVGQKLYIYNVSNKDLKTVMETRMLFKILDVDTNLAKAYVKGGDNLYVINKK